jgi:glycosyltransferase involved in cell wall biosynthesis
MRIVLVNWARIWDGAGYGGGVNGYCQSLALALKERGHDVVSLFGGISFVPTPTADRTSPCFIRRHDDWLGVRVFEVINSPVMAPSIVQYEDPLGEVSSPELEAEVGRLFGLIKPDVVHFHNIEGFSIGCVEVAKRAGAKVVFSLHNYHTICPQVYLMQGHKRVCHDSDAGHNCTNCIETTPLAAERRERARRFVRGLMGDSGDTVAEIRREMRVELKGLKQELTWPVRVAKRTVKLVQLRREIQEAVGNRAGLPGHAVDSVESVTCPREVPEAKRPRTTPETETVERPASPDYRGQTQGILDDMYRKPKTVDPDDPARKPLLNIALPDPPATKAPNEYGQRRRAMVEMLNGCDRVLAVSEFVCEKFVAMGVKRNVIEPMHIGSRISRIVERNQELVYDPPAFDPALPMHLQRPVRVVFMGYNNLYKGLHVFADALEMLTPEFLSRIDLNVWALHGQSIEWRFRRLEPRLAGLKFHNGYNYQDIPWMLGGKDLGVVPSVWWDNAPQTVFEFQSCAVPVLGANVGGIPDFVFNEVNGLLFQGNNPWDLARQLTGVLRRPWRLAEFRRNVKSPKEMDPHVLELENVYGATRR